MLLYKSNKTLELVMESHTSDARIWKAEAGASEVQREPQLHSKFKAILDYMENLL